MMLRSRTHHNHRHARLVTRSSGDVIVISTEEEKPKWKAWTKFGNVTLLRLDAFFTCILKQALDTTTGTLSL